ncbi:hypothetical protein B0H14DRAFT_3134829 [Mycena olivaceomarginata]|nr:hypothetical protein B0H14DRAFT_3134829 [Mycena olivaceomarginata]
MAFGISQYQVAATAVTAGLSPGAAIGAVTDPAKLLDAQRVVGLEPPTELTFPSSRALRSASTETSLLFWLGQSLVSRGSASKPIKVGISFWRDVFDSAQLGGQCLQAMLSAIFPSFKSFKNHLPPSAHVTSSQLLCFLRCYLAATSIHVQSHRNVSRFVSSFSVSVGWAVGRAHGFGPLFAQKTDVHGSPVALVFISGVSSAIAGETTLALNICASILVFQDFTRFAKSPRVVVWATILSLSIPLTLSASTAVGNDLAILFPRYINVRRGQYICALWIIQNTSTSFTYTHGVNWRAVAAFMLALIPSLPGFAAKINTKIKVPIGARYIFALVWPVGVIVGGACYLLFSAVWPVHSQKLDCPEPAKAPSFSSDGDLEKSLHRCYGTAMVMVVTCSDTNHDPRLPTGYHHTILQAYFLPAMRSDLAAVRARIVEIKRLIAELRAEQSAAVYAIDPATFACL